MDTNDYALFDYACPLCGAGKDDYCKTGCPDATAGLTACDKPGGCGNPQCPYCPDFA